MKKVSILIPVYNVKPERFERTLASLVNQTSQDFEVCISDGGEKNVKDIIKKYENKIDIKYNKSENKLGISENTNNALKLATGDFISFLDHDDILVNTAIEDVLEVFSENDYDVLYSDEQIVDEDGNILNRFYKPDFSIDLLYSQNYICHFLVIKREIVDLVGSFNSKFDGAQDYDYILRVIEKTKKVGHISKILYSWLSTEESTSTNSDAKPYAQEAGLNALDSHLKRVYGKNVHAEETDYLFVYQPIFNNLDNKKIDIIIPMKDKWTLTQECVHSIIDKTSYKNYYITIIDNNSEDDISKAWLKEISSYDKRIRVIEANFEFNWSKLQNFGINNSDADVFVFLNNDTVIIDPDWLTKLATNALRDEVGVVGPLLCYEDGTIQHAGVVIGLGGYAGHVFMGMNTNHGNVNYVSPMVSRNVLAVTGACMAISRTTLDIIGYFNEDFIICGSDVEICIRAYEKGLRNIYLSTTKIIHLESKSRDSYIPSIDFKLSKKYYKKYWEMGDPFYNKNLNYNCTTPTPLEYVEERVEQTSKIKKVLKKSKILVHGYRSTKRVLKKCPLFVKIYRKIRHIEIVPAEVPVVVDFTIPEIKNINPIPTTINSKYRINILIPSLNKEKVFGGIATAMKFFEQFNDADFAKRIIVTDTTMKPDDLDNYQEYSFIDNSEKSDIELQVVNIHEDPKCNLLVAENDIFIATGWWTAYSIKSVIEWQKEHFKQRKMNSLIYFIQDYEPFFYPWSSRQCSAESTYRMSIPTIAVFNSKELMDYFDLNNYKFSKKYYFDPILNDGLRSHLLKDPEVDRAKQIIVYGRPSVSRNAFEIIEEALMLVFENRDDIEEWKFVSMGEAHPDAKITDTVSLKSVGKLSLDEYAYMMEESYIGISLMVSPHPSYPPLEMSSFGVKTITNNYANKDISYFNENIISVEHCDALSVAKELEKLVNDYDKNAKKCKKVINDNYVNSREQFTSIISNIKKDIEEGKKHEQKKSKD